MIEAMKQALEALEDWKKYMPGHWDLIDEQAITSLRQAIAEAEKQIEEQLKMADENQRIRAELKFNTIAEADKQEPVACPYCQNSHTLGAVYFDQNCVECVKRMTRPQPAAWVGLTDEERNELWNWVYYAHNEAPMTPFLFAKSIETKLKAKNERKEKNT